MGSTGPHQESSSAGPQPFRAKVKSWLNSYRPRFRDWRFWAVQALVIGIALGHTAVEASGSLGMLYFVPYALFVIPVVYASLNFGFKGSIATSLWATLITVPNWIWMHHDLERWGGMFQMAAVNALAVFVGQRVDREMRARESAESAASEARASETKYRGLFEAAPAAILVLSPRGAVLEANPAASLLFGQDRVRLQGVFVGELLGAPGARRILELPSIGARSGEYLPLRNKEGEEIYLEPSLTLIEISPGVPALQVILRDVTESQHREAGLKAHTARVLRAQEEERKRIAQELHDDAVQKLILLCRQLDTVGDGDSTLPPDTLSSVLKARNAAEEIAQGLLDFSRALRPPALDDLGLASAIRAALADLTERTQIQAELKIDGRERRLPPETELALFRIAQEALRNVERHARAKGVTAVLTFAEDKISLVMQDDGVGFSLPEGASDFAAHGLLGLLGMKERAESLGGRLEIQSRPGAGTIVIVSLNAQP